MARKFWERVSNQRLRFYTDPVEYTRDDIDAEIARLQAILVLPDSTKALIAAGLPGLQSEADFNDHFQDEIDRLADIRDYLGYDQQTENITTVLQGWMSPADMTLGPGTIVSVCGEKVGNEAINAIDGLNGTNWQHDVNEVHEITFDLGYPKRIDGIRIRNTASPGNPLLLSGVQVFVAQNVNGLSNNANSHVGVDLEFTDPNDNDRDLTARMGRYVRLQVGSTAHNNNHVTIREIELRVRARTFGL